MQSNYCRADLIDEVLLCLRAGFVRVPSWRNAQRIASPHPDGGVRVYVRETGTTYLVSVTEIDSPADTESEW